MNVCVREREREREERSCAVQFLLLVPVVIKESYLSLSEELLWLLDLPRLLILYASEKSGG